MILKPKHKLILQLREESEYNNAMACYATCNDNTLYYDVLNIYNRHEISLREEITLVCILNELLYRGLKVTI